MIIIGLVKMSFCEIHHFFSLLGRWYTRVYHTRYDLTFGWGLVAPWTNGLNPRSLTNKLFGPRQTTTSWRPSRFGHLSTLTYLPGSLIFWCLILMPSQKKTTMSYDLCVMSYWACLTSYADREGLVEDADQQRVFRHHQVDGYPQTEEDTQGTGMALSGHRLLPGKFH